MGIRERQEREKDATRRAILDAARALFVKEGFANVSIRRIAERVEYSPAAIYTYFPSKDDILLALAREGFDLLATQRPRPGLDQLAPLDAVRAIFGRIYEFSKQHPEYFALMFFERSIPLLARESGIFDQVLEHKRKLMVLLDRCATSGAIPQTVPPAVLFRVVSMGLFGVTALRLAGRLTERSADRLAVDTVEASLAGLIAGSPVTFRPEQDLPAAGAFATTRPGPRIRAAVRARVRDRLR